MAPFQINNWTELVHLVEIDYERIVTSCIADDFFIVGNDDCHFFMFERIGYKLIEKGFVRNYLINCMLVLTDNMVVFGHVGSVLTLWDTSKRVLDQQELSRLKESITKQEVSKIDLEQLRLRNLPTS